MSDVRCHHGSGRRPRFELAELVRAHGEQLARSHPPSPEQARVLRDVSRCRTPALGGHLDKCVECDFKRPAYNSCRNRHCPKCQALAQHRWLERRLERILPTHHFHVVFTVPSELHPLCRQHPTALYDLLFASATDALLTLGRDPKWLGAQLGITAILHTWTRELRFHPHLHAVVTGGGLASDGERWLATPRDFLFPVHVAGALFRGKLLAGLQALLDDGAIATPDDWPALRDRLYHHRWVAYCEPPFGGPEHVFRYLGRYTHRIAISNHRLLDVDDDHVTFATKHGKRATLHPTDFLRRFLQHVMPPGYVRIRHYGLLASRNVGTKLAAARGLLRGERGFVPRRLRRRPADDWRDLMLALTGVELRLCPRCRTLTLRRLPLASARAPPTADPTMRAA